MAIKKKHLWRSRFSPPQTYDGITYIHYYEDIGIYAFGYAYTGMFFSGVGAWLFDFKFYPLPPQTEFINQGYLLHYFYWVKTTIHTALPFLYKGSAKAYHDYYLTLQYYGYAHLLTYRLLFVAGITIGAFVMGFLNKLSNPIKGVVENHVRGMKLLKFEEANEELIENFESENKQFGKFTEIAEGVFMSKKRLFTHTILRGLPNVYLLEKPFIKIPKIVEGWVEKPQLEAISNNTNRVKRSLISKAEVAAKQEIEKVKTAPKKIEAPIEEEIIEEEYEGNFVDTGQHMDAMSEEEKKFYEEDVENEAIKSIAMDSMIDNHGITTAIDLFSTMLEKTPITKKPKILQQTLKPNSQR